jgi:signal transduction histidine kinase
MAIAGKVVISMKSIKSRLVWQYSFIVILTVLVLEVFFISAVQQYYYSSTEQLLKNRASVYASFYKKNLPSNSIGFLNSERAQYILENVADDEPANVELIDWRGNVVADSSGVIPERHVDTPDFKAALQGETEVWRGKNLNTDERVMAVSIPFRSSEGTVLGILRYVTSTEQIHAAIVQISFAALALGLLVILLVTGISLLLAKSIVNPIQNIIRVAEQFALGNFTVKVNKQQDDEIGKLADTLNYMSEEIKKSDQVKNNFLSSISHELRTPLTSIKGWGETIILGDLRDKGEAKEGLRIICNETDRMIKLVEELLEFSCFQSGRIKLNRNTVNFNGIVTDVVHQLSVNAEDKNIDFQVSLDNKLPMIVGDQNRLKQVMINLLDNAIKFSPSDGSINIGTTRIEDSVVVEVADNGEGINLNDLPRVTEKFYKANINRSGSGLGMSIVKEIVELHQGDMEIESQLGAGTKVTVVLPIS